MGLARKQKRSNEMPKWIVIGGAVLALVASFGAAVNYGGTLYRVPFNQEALDKRLTRVEGAVEQITTRLGSIEQSQASSAKASENIQSSLMKLTASIETLNATSLETWKRGFQNEEKLKSFQVYVDERLGNIDQKKATP